jgi:hypothetical protein
MRRGRSHLGGWWPEGKHRLPRRDQQPATTSPRIARRGALTALRSCPLFRVNVAGMRYSMQFYGSLVYWFASFYFTDSSTGLSSGLNMGALAGILVGAITAAIAVSVVSTIFIMRRRSKRQTVSRRSCKSFNLFSQHSFSCATH